jgi:hypothetical protein
MLISSSLSLFIFEEVSEEILLITWSVFQTLRIIFIAKKQNLAQQSAKTLIDFTNIIDTEAGDGIHSARYQLPPQQDKKTGDEVIVFDMKQLE